jgi:iron complex outermembrane receptor protein
MNQSLSTQAYKRVAAAVALACGGMASQAVVAQEPLEEVTVTGSFISRPADRPQPVSVMDAGELRANQRVSVVEALRDMPQISDANVVENWNTPTSSIDLRALGPRATLVLLNGQRQTIDANSASQVDVNNLAPAIMLERIELVLDGASALYGSDAVAGVANFITRNNFEGSEISVSSQFAEAQSDVPEILVGGIFGVQGNDIGVVMGFEFLKRSDEMQSADVFSNERLGEGLITGLYNPGTFGALGPARPGDVRVAGGFFADPLCGSTEIGGLPENVIWDPAGATEHNADGLPSPGDSFCRGTLSLQRTIIPENDRFTGMAVVTKDFGNDTSLTWETNFARVATLSSFGTGVPLLALPSLSAKLPVTNPGVIDANQRDPNFPLQDYRTIFTRQASPLEGSLPSHAKQHTFRTSLTLDGLINNSWDWRVNGTGSWNQQNSGTSDTIADRYARALEGYGGGDCKFNPVTGAANDPNIQPGVGNCQYWNPFASRLLAQPGDATYNSPTLADWMTDEGTERGDSSFFSVEGVVTGELWEMGGGATGVALGLQFRQQELDIFVDSVSKDGGFGFAPQVVQDWSSSRETKAFFAELVMFPSDSLEIDIAARFEDTDGQSSTEPKLSALWTPTDSLFVRFSAGSSFRLASERQTFGIGPSGTTIRPIGGEVNQARALSVGNPALLPEESENWTLGFTWDTTDNLTLEVNYWEYDFTNLVTAVSPDDILLADWADGFITDPRIELFPGRPNEVCEITGRWDDSQDASGNYINPLPAGCMNGFDIALFKSSFINQNTVETSGIDFNVDWRRDLAGGQFGVRLLATYVDRYAGTATDGTIIDVVGTDGGNVAGVGTNPQIRANVITTFDKGNHSARWSTRFTDGTTLRNPGAFEYNTDDSSWTQHDVVYGYSMGSGELSVAVLNLFDNEPPLQANTLTTVNSSLYDPRGRMWRVVYDRSF